MTIGNRTVTQQGLLELYAAMVRNKRNHLYVSTETGTFFYSELTKIPTQHVSRQEVEQELGIPPGLTDTLDDKAPFKIGDKCYYWDYDQIASYGSSNVPIVSEGDIVTVIRYENEQTGVQYNYVVKRYGDARTMSEKEVFKSLKAITEDLEIRSAQHNALP